MKKGEALEQETLVEWSHYQQERFPELKLLFAIPNGGSRNKIEAANLKRQGVLAGVPDLMLPVARGGWHGLFIELKYGKNKASEKQREYIEMARQQGYRAEICYGWEEAANLLKNYLMQGK